MLLCISAKYVYFVLPVRHTYTVAGHRFTDYFSVTVACQQIIHCLATINWAMPACDMQKLYACMHNSFQAFFCQLLLTASNA